MARNESRRAQSDEIEGVVYHVEPRGTMEFLAKHVSTDEVARRYLPEMSDQPAVWNWKPDW